MIDAVVPEPPGGAQNDHDEAARLLKAALLEALEELEDVPGEELRRRRRAKFPGCAVCLISAFCGNIQAIHIVTGFSTECTVVTAVFRAFSRP